MNVDHLEYDDSLPVASTSYTGTTLGSSHSVIAVEAVGHEVRVTVDGENYGQATPAAWVSIAVSRLHENKLTRKEVELLEDIICAVHHHN